MNAGDISTNAKGKTTHAFALALCTHNHEAVQTFLQYVKPDEAPVDGAGHKWGAVHCATDPVGHDSMFRYGPEKLNQILNMLDLLKTYDADFNFTPKGMYSNPPLALGDLQAVMGVPPQCKKTIAKILVIHGSNPFMLGTSGVSYYLKSWRVEELKSLIEEGVGHSILERLAVQYTQALNYNQSYLTKYYGDLFEDQEEAVAAGGEGAGAGAFDVDPDVAAGAVCTTDMVVELAGDTVSTTVADTGEF